MIGFPCHPVNAFPNSGLISHTFRRSMSILDKQELYKMEEDDYKYIAHSANRNGEEQSMKQHSEGVAELMKSFALADDFAELYSYCGFCMILENTVRDFRNI